MSDSLWPHELQHPRPPYPSPTPGVHPNPCPSSRRCHPTISSSVIPFSSCPQSFLALGSFPMSQLFTSGSQSIGVSASTSPSSQGYGFSSSHVGMWELDYRESWAPKNWCFWTVVLEKTLESSLGCREIQPVHPKGYQSWVFIVRTHVEAETPILWPPDEKNWLAIWQREEKNCITNMSNDFFLELYTEQKSGRFLT